MSKEDPLPGYKGEVRSLLEKAGVKVWSEVEVRNPRRGMNFRGILLPRAEYTAQGYINLKVDTGYNVGIKLEPNMLVEELGYLPGEYRVPSREIARNPNLANVTLLGTGGTVASRLDYRTGAVLPAFTPEELFAAVPEIESRVNLTPKTLFKILSENFRPKWWVQTAEHIAKEIESGVDGVIIGHGTDTMSYTGSALSFFLKNLPIPVVLLGSQRSSDRPSSDAAINILNACSVAGYADLGEVVICMLASTSHRYGLLHRPSRVRKMHSSRRDAFRSLSDMPIAKIENQTGEITYFQEIKKRAKREDFVLDCKIDDRVGILYFYPGMNPDILHSLIDINYHGIVIIGTGLGHVNTDMYDALSRAQEQEIPIVIVVQPLYGFAHLRVYETGREMLARGVIEGGNMLPEAAYAKLCWVLGHTRDMGEVKRLMQTNIAGELTNREPKYGYLLLQGYEDHLEEVLKRI
ncbi:MAG: Glu-tRNA(Gln) amidotransferase subunit GatD [Candidatus Hermodarchaeota archaeon]